MELRHLRYFVVLAEHLSFTRAAEAVHISQSTLSHQIKHLERELGCTLFDRTSREVSMTQQGAALLPFALRILRDVEDGRRILLDGQPQLTGTVRVGVLSTVHPHLINGTIQKLIDQNPGVMLELLELSGEELDERLRAGTLDIGIGYEPKNRTGLWYEALYEDELALVVGEDHLYARRKRINVSELHNHRIAIHSETRNEWEGFLKIADSKPVIFAEVNKMPILLLLAATSGVGVIAPRRTAEIIVGVKTIALEHPAPVIKFGLIWNVAGRQTTQMASTATILRKLVKDQALVHFAPIPMRAID